MQTRQLIIMRHATAESAARDHARPLSPRGRDEAHRVGLVLRDRGTIPQHVLCSSALRCRETWQGVCAGLGASPSVDFADSLYDASAEALLDALAGIVDAEVVLLLAHNPGVSVLAIELARGDEADVSALRAGFAPGSIACFEFEGPWSSISSSSARLTRFARRPGD